MKTIEPAITGHKVVSRDEWIAARKELLIKEKEQTRLRDQLAAERRALPWVKSRRLQVGVIDRQRLQLRLPRLLHERTTRHGQGVLQLPNDRCLDR